MIIIPLFAVIANTLKTAGPIRKDEKIPWGSVTFFFLVYKTGFYCVTMLMLIGRATAQSRQQQIILDPHK